MSCSPPKPGLHTLEDPAASAYVNENLSDENDEIRPLLAPALNPSIPNPYSSLYTQLPQVTASRFPHNQYYVQQSYEDRESLLQYSDDNGRCGLSPVRRMFLLLTLFDFLLTFLMWIIYLQVQNRLKNEMKNLKVDIRNNFCDVVILSFSRSVLLLATYSCVFKVRKWYMVALTTTTSTVFLIVKVFYIKFTSDAQPLNYLLVIFSFIICWCEAWHFDFKVIPNESGNFKSIPGLADSVVAGRQATAEPPRSEYRRRGYSRAKSSAFFTPYAGSVFRDRSPSEDTDSSFSDLSGELNEVEERDRQLIRVSKDNVHMVFRMLYINDGWNLEREEKDNITVYSRHFDGVGKVFKLESLIDVQSRVLNQLFWEDVDSQPSWNASVKETQIVTKINSKTDILYSVTAETGSGVIASRDFVVLRRRKRKGALTLLTCVSIATDLVPVKQSVIRGRNGPGGWILRDIPGEPAKTEFIWLLNTTLGGWLPKRLVEQSLAGVMVDTTRDIRKHVTNLPDVR